MPRQSAEDKIFCDHIIRRSKTIAEILAMDGVPPDYFTASGLMDLAVTMYLNMGIDHKGVAELMEAWANSIKEKG